MGLLPTSYDPNSKSFEAWTCSMFGLMSLTTQGFSKGAVQVAVDGVPMAGSNSLNSSQYLWTDDALQITYYGDTGLFSATVNHPKLGVNDMASAMYSDDAASDCWFTLKTGTVTITDFSGAESTRWMTGSFAVDFTGTNTGSAGTTCPRPLGSSVHRSAPDTSTNAVRLRTGMSRTLAGEVAHLDFHSEWIAA